MKIRSKCDKISFFLNMSDRKLRNIVILIQLLVLVHISTADDNIRSNINVNQYIHKVLFSGNKLLDKKSLAKISNIQPKQIFDPVIIENGIYNILNEYKKQGYLFAKAEWNYEGDTKVIINIKIDEGKRIRIGKIDLTGDFIFSKEQILNMFNVLKGDFFNETLFENDIEQLLRFYSDNGYPKAVISPTVFDINDDKLNISVQIQAGSMNKIGKITINGLKKTKEKVVIREIPIRSGDIFNQSRINETERLLNNIRFFQLSSPITLISAEDDKIDLDLNIVELPSGIFSGIIGYNPSDYENGKLIGTISAEESNLFGTGRHIAIMAKFGMADVYELLYEEPWILGKPINLGFITQSTNRSDTLMNREFREKGIRLNVIGKITGFTTGSVGLAYKRIKYFSINKDLEKTNDTENIKNKYSIIFEGQRDSRDYSVNATKGRFDKIGTEFSLGDVKIFKLWIDLNQYFKIYRQQILVVGLHAGKIWGNDLPITELFYLGGANTLRGYSEDMLRGEGRAYSNIEYRFLTGNNSQFFIFLDNGTVFSKLDEFSPLKIGYGLGMRIESMNGIISLDYGLAKGESILKGKIHISLGAVF
ncbi:MAG: BamA/OMP85 family outer membrane protein [Candidatus Poribacteria bacterium]